MTPYPELDHLSLDELISRFQGPPPEEEEYADAYYQEVALRIGQHGAPGVTFLLEERDIADTHRLRAILFALTLPQLEQPLVRDILLSYVHDDRPLIVAEAIDSLWTQGVADAHDEVLALRNYPSPYVRGSVLRYLSNLFPEEARPLLLRSLNDNAYLVRENAVDELDELGAIDALPALYPLLADPHPHVRQAAETAVKNLEELARGAEGKDHTSQHP